MKALRGSLRQPDRSTLPKMRQAGRRGERGNSAVELALILPLFASIVFGAADLARLFFAHITVASAAHEAASYLAQNQSATDSDLQAVAAAESQRLAGNFLVFSGSGTNTTLTKVTSNASGTTNTTMFVRVQVTYTFRPTVSIPLSGPVPIVATADAPKTRALT